MFIRNVAGSVKVERILVKSDRAKRRFALVGLVLLSAVAIGVTSTQATNLNDGRGSVTGGVGDTVALVDGQPIGTADFVEQVAIVNSNLSYMQGQIAAGSLQSSYLRQFIAIITSDGVTNVAFGSLIENEALYEMATARGYSPSDTDVNGEVAKVKSLVDSGKAPVAFQSAIAAVGAQSFWMEIYPNIVRRTLAIDALQMQVVSSNTDSPVSPTSWLNVQKQAVAFARIVVLNPAAIAPATRASALAYLQDYWQLPTQ